MGIFATIIGRRLRRHNLAALSLTVFLQTNSFREDQPQYCNSSFYPFAEAVNDDMRLSAAAMEALNAIFRRGYGYKRAGIIIGELCDAGHIQQSLFADSSDREKRERLMAALDAINSSSLSHDRIHIAAYMPVESVVRCEHRSPHYTTRLEDIITVK